MSDHLLVRMDEATFRAIPGRVVPRTVRLEDPTLAGPRAEEWIFSGYCEKLLFKNEKLQEMLRRFAGRLDDAECWSRLTHGQRILYSLAALDGQVKNGGVAQFLWNCPDLILSANESLATLRCSEASAAFERVIESLIGNKGRWLDLRNQSCTDPAGFWGPFQATYDLLDLDWFDDAYFREYGPRLIGLLIKYVRDNTKEFIEP